MNDTNLQKKAIFKTKISKDLYWVPANCLSNCKVNNSNVKDEPHNLFELLCLFQKQGLEECYDDRILKIDKESSLEWEFFDSPEIIVKHYKRGHCAVFSIWLNFYLKKMYNHCGYIEIIRDKNRSWHVINYVYIDGLYYIIDPNVYIKKYSKVVPVENGEFCTYAKSKLITGGILQTSNLDSFVNYYQKYISLADSSYLFLKFNTYKLPAFSIEERNNVYNVYYPNDIDFEIIGEYNKNKFYIHKTELFF